MSKQIRVVLALALVALGGGYWWWYHQGKETTDNAYIKADIVPLMASVSGRVDDMNAPDNIRVKEGQVLLRLDPVGYQAQLDQARAESRRAAAALVHLTDSEAQQQALIRVAEAAVEAADAQARRTHQHLERLEKLAGQQYVSQNDLEDAQLDVRAADAGLRQAQAQHAAQQATLVSIRSERPGLQATQASAEAAVRQAEQQLNYTDVIAPRAGTITSRMVQLGQSVTPGQRLLSIVTEPLWIYANYKETQIEDMQVGDAVDIEVDAFPGKIFHGHVDSFFAATGSEFALLPPQNATGNFTKVVQRLPVKIVFDDSQDLNGVRAGMSVVTTVFTQHD